MSSKASAVSVGGLLLAVWLLPQLVTAQGICVSEARTLPAVSGAVTFPNGVPIQGATLELHEKEYGGKVVAQIKSDGGGRFEFENIRAGRYVLVAKAEMLFALSVPLKVTGKRPPKNRKVELRIQLNGLPDEPCGGGSVELRVCEIK